MYAIISMGIMENKMETTIVYRGLYGITGKENGNHDSIYCPLYVGTAARIQSSTPYLGTLYLEPCSHYSARCARRLQLTVIKQHLMEFCVHE